MCKQKHLLQLRNWLRVIDCAFVDLGNAQIGRRVTRLGNTSNVWVTLDILSKFLVMFKACSRSIESTNITLELRHRHNNLGNRLIASSQVIEFKSNIRLKSWRFVLTRLKSLDNSISKIESTIRIDFYTWNRNSTRKNRFKLSRLLFKLINKYIRNFFL